MKTVETLVRAKLEGELGQEESVALWMRLWAAHEKGGDSGAEALLASLLMSSGHASAEGVRS